MDPPGGAEQLIRSLAPLLFLGAACVPAGAQAGGESWTVAGRGIERGLTIRDGVLRTTFVRGGGVTIHVAGGELAVGLADGRVLTAADFVARKSSDVRVDLTGRGNLEELRLSVRHQAHAALPLLQKSVVVESAPGGLIRWIAVEAIRCTGGSRGGERLGEPSMERETLGQPVLVAEVLLAALAHPSGHNQHDGRGTLRLLHHAPASGEGRPAVLLLAAPDRLHRLFREFLESRRPPPRPFVHYNTWYDLRRGELSARSLLHEVDALRAAVKIDGIVLDDGWQRLDALWREDEGAFEGGLQGLSAALRERGLAFGLWLSIPGHSLDPGAEGLAGLERMRSGHFDPAAPGYARALAARLEELRRLGVAHVKLDFNHQLRVNEPAALDTQTDATIAILRTLRSGEPPISTNLTSFAWLSPFWLLHTDFLWMASHRDDGHDYGIPALRLRDRAMTFRDGEIEERVRGTSPWLPLSAVMTHGIIDGRLRRLGGDEEDPRSFADAVMNYLGSGTLLRELYLSPSSMSHDASSFLGPALRWAARETELLARARPLPGSPRRGELHGTSSAAGTRCIVSVRNPTPTSRELVLQMSDLWWLSGTPPPRAAAAVIYPRRERVAVADGEARLRIGPFECLVVELGAAEQLGPLIEDWPAAEDRRLIAVLGKGEARGVVRYEGKSPGTLRLMAVTEVVSGVAPEPRVLVDEKPVPLARASGGGAVRTATVPVEPGARLAFRLLQPEDGPFAAEWWQRLHLIAEENRHGEDVPTDGDRFPPLPPPPVRNDGTLVVESGRRTFGVPPHQLTAASRLATSAVVRLEVFGSDGGRHRDKWVVCADRRLGRIPANESGELDAWEVAEIPIEGEELVALELARRDGRSVTLRLEDPTADFFKVRNVQLAVRLGELGWVVSEPDPRVHCSVMRWAHAEGEPFEQGRSKQIVLVLP